MSRQYRNFFLGELLAIAVAVIVFRTISERILAGVIAGSFFSALGLWIFTQSLRHRAMLFSGTFWLGAIHLFVIALPMMVTRLLNHMMEFKEVAILGLPGPVFHQLSTGVYFLLLIATALDFYRWRRREKKESSV